MLIEKGQTWYAELLRLSLSESRDLQINPRNCIGTVLALNGHRKYFCMYHAKHPESVRGAKVSIHCCFHIISCKNIPIGMWILMNSDFGTKTFVWFFSLSRLVTLFHVY